MNRRGFLGALLGAAAGLALDPEKLLYVPGKKLISIPNAAITEPTLDEINRITLQYISPMLMDNIFKRSPIIYKARQLGMSSMLIPSAFIYRTATTSPNCVSSIKMDGA